MAHRLARTGTALAAAAVLMLPGAAAADSVHEHATPSASPSADPHAGHDMGGREDHTPAPEPSSSEDAHDHGAPSEDAGGSHDDHGTPPEQDAGGHEDHGTTPEDDGGGHSDHGTAPDSVSPEVRNLVLSGFAGVNAAVIFGAWMVRRTGPDPDPRKRTSKASR